MKYIYSNKRKIYIYTYIQIHTHTHTHTHTYIYIYIYIYIYAPAPYFLELDSVCFQFKGLILYECLFLKIIKLRDLNEIG